MALLEPLSGAARYPLRAAADLVAVLDRWVWLEYVPSTTTEQSLAFVPRERRAAAG